MFPNARLMARAFHRVPPSTIQSTTTKITQTTSNHARRFSASSPASKWEGRKPEDHAARETDSPNAQHDAARKGKAERAKGGESAGTSEKASGAGEENLNKKAEKEYPGAAKPVIGMNDERGGKGR